MSGRPPFPTVLDSSLIAAARSCMYKANLDFFEHWKPKTPSVHLHAGGAFAKGLEVARTAFYLGDYHFPPDEKRGETEWRVEQREPGNEADSISIGLLALLWTYGDFECPPDSAKSRERTAGAFEYYFSMYPLREDKAVPVALPSGRRGIEFSFAEPIDVRHPETGDPLLYVGRMDMMTDYLGARWGEDDKTTSQLGASWSRQWDLRSQFTGYCWGGQKSGHPLAGFIVRGVSILKTKYETQQAITYRPQWMIDLWYEQLVERDVPTLIQMWESGKWGMSLDHACNEYGGCGYRNICLTEPGNRISWLKTHFERRKWDPVTREETKLEDDA